MRLCGSEHFHYLLFSGIQASICTSRVLVPRTRSYASIGILWIVQISTKISASVSSISVSPSNKKLMFHQLLMLLMWSLWHFTVMLRLASSHATLNNHIYISMICTQRCEFHVVGIDVCRINRSICTCRVITSLPLFTCERNKFPWKNCANSMIYHFNFKKRMCLVCLVEMQRWSHHRGK